MSKQEESAYWKGYRDALKDIWEEAKMTPVFTDDDILKKIIQLVWDDRYDKEREEE